MDDITDSVNLNLGKLWEMVRDREAWHAAVHGVATELTELNRVTIYSLDVLLFLFGTSPLFHIQF